jgi:hypothetical protein
VCGGNTVPLFNSILQTHGVSVSASGVEDVTLPIHAPDFQVLFLKFVSGLRVFIHRKEKLSRF